jgi:hypothetical protein
LALLVEDAELEQAAMAPEMSQDGDFSLFLVLIVRFSFIVYFSLHSELCHN